MRRLGLLIAALIAAAAAGCGSGGAAGGSSSGGGMTTLNVGVLPTADVAPLYLGIKKGFFRQEKLDIRPQQAAGGAVLVPSVVSGSDQFSYSNVVSLMLGATKGLPLQIVANGDTSGSTPSTDFTGIAVRGNSPIHAPSQLGGKTIAVNTLKNIVELGVKATLARDGVNASTIKPVEVDFPDMPAALAAGRVDAVAVSEPFRTEVVKDGGRIITPFFQPIHPGLIVGAYFTTKQYAAQHADVVTRFQRAMQRSLAYAQAHPGEVRSALTTYTKVTPALASQIVLPTYGPKLDRASMSLLAGLMVRFGLTSSKPDVSKLAGSTP